MINQKKQQNFEAFGTQIPIPLIPKINTSKPEVCEKRKFVPIKKQQNNFSSQLQQNKQQSLVKIEKETIIEEKKTICQKPKQSRNKQIKKALPQLKSKVEESIQINQEITNPEVDKPLTYVIIRTVKIKEIKGEIILNYKDKAECLQIRNRLLNFDDVKQKFPYIENLNEKILIEIDNNIIMKKNQIGWMDCRDCEEYLLQ
ncbi:unnamed protein product [Paramecium primaurelia]|uniref:Uncharacterized protein n=1 Tax=Paramecium primaurelia TaxID=5886 RepID=A0A8S1NDW8_PARPR|nr:unnamed protein product [Paramecium primaurelia]